MSNQKSKITYSDSGVDIDKANDLIDEIKPMIKQTLTAGVLSNIGGFGGYVSSLISEELFEYLDAPIMRVSSLDTPVPFADSLEKVYLANSRLIDKIFTLYHY